MSRSEHSKLLRELDYRDDKLKRLELEADRLFKRKQELADLLNSKEDESLKKIEKSYDSYQKEIARYRKERDEMREMYEVANSQVSSLTKNSSHLQLIIDGLKAKISMLESKADAKKPLISDDSLLEELSTIEIAYDALREQHEKLVKECLEKESVLSSTVAEKMRCEFKMAQVLKSSEVESKKSADLEMVYSSKMSSIQSRERSLLDQIKSLEGDVMDKKQVIEDLKRKLLDCDTKYSELDKSHRTLLKEFEMVPPYSSTNF